MVWQGSRVNLNFGRKFSYRQSHLNPRSLLEMAKVRYKADESWRKPVYGLIMPTENILQSRRSALHVERDALEDNTAVRFSPDAIESCLIIPVEILVCHDVVKIYTWIKLIQKGCMLIERPSGGAVSERKLGR